MRRKAVDTQIAKVPGGAELRLKRRTTEFSITLDHNELINSRRAGRPKWR